MRMLNMLSPHFVSGRVFAHANYAEKHNKVPRKGDDAILKHGKVVFIAQLLKNLDITATT